MRPKKYNLAPKSYDRATRGTGKDFANKEKADSAGLIRFAIMAYFEAMPLWHDVTTAKKIYPGADLMITRFACSAAKWLSTASSAFRVSVSTAPIPSGFPSGAIGGIIGHARPTAKDHVRRNALLGRARGTFPATFLLACLAALELDGVAPEEI